MAGKSTLLKTSFFIVLIAGVMAIQYNWLRTLKNDRSEVLKQRIIQSIDQAGNNHIFTAQQRPTADVIGKLLRQSFSAKGVTDIDFEFLFKSGIERVASAGYTRKLLDESDNLRLEYLFEPVEKAYMASKTLTVIVKSPSKFIMKDMIWHIGAAVLLTVMIGIVFYWTSRADANNRQPFYRNRAVKTIMQQLETRLSTVSVAAEALRNARVMNDAGKVLYYQQVIDEENQRINEQVDKFIGEFKAV